jgi:hypothetical protein
MRYIQFQKQKGGTVGEKYEPIKVWHADRYCCICYVTLWSNLFMWWSNNCSELSSLDFNQGTTSLCSWYELTVKTCWTVGFRFIHYVTIETEQILSLLDPFLPKIDIKFREVIRSTVTRFKFF